MPRQLGPRDYTRSHIPSETWSRPSIRLEAENFVTLDGYRVLIHDRKLTSHGVIVQSADAAGHISTPFPEPFSKASARYDVEVNYLDEAPHQPEFELSVNGKPQGTAWKSSGTGLGWTKASVINSTGGDFKPGIIPPKFGRRVPTLTNAGSIHCTTVPRIPG